MEVTALCITLLLLLLTAQAQNDVHKADAAFPHIEPNRQQFFEYESLSLNCAKFHGPTEWRVMRKASRWETSEGSLDITPTFTRHSGEYWCENGDGERSNALNITVTDRAVILESPALPVMEQQTVTLLCRKKAGTSSSSADFLKDGLIYKTGYTGEVTIHHVSKSDEGLYKCKLLKDGESLESWLAVRAPQETTPQDGQQTPRHPPDSASIQLSIPLTIVFTVLCVAVLLLVLGFLKCQKHKVACFSSEMPTTRSETVNEHAIADPQIATYAGVKKPKKNRGHEHAAADQQIATYASVKKPKKNRGCQEANVVDDSSDVTYAVVTTRKKTRKKQVPGEANTADTDTSTYAAVAIQQKDRGH